MESKNIIFCTYFDKYYLLKGLAMHSSLIQHNPEAKLWVLTMDLYTEQMLNKLKLKGVTIIPLSKFEDQKLLKIKNHRNMIEYYWTCTPSLPLYIFNNNKDNQYCIYVDADFMFFSSIVPFLDELDNNSILIVEHRYPKEQLYRENTSGKFNVGILAFKKDKEGLRCIARWRNQCLEWCFFREEGRKMGDQMYLNEWPKLYNKLTISENLGVNAAPWNISQYNVNKVGDQIFINADLLICYHFHQFSILGPNKFSMAYGYKLSSRVKNFIYKPYIDEINRQIGIIRGVDPNFNIFINTKIKLKDKVKNLFSPVFKFKKNISGKN